jgi:hypothetical protein
LLSVESRRTAIQGDLSKVKDFHLEFKSKGGKFKYCSKIIKSATRKSKDCFFGHRQDLFLQVGPYRLTGRTSHTAAAAAVEAIQPQQQQQ